MGDVEIKLNYQSREEIVRKLAPALANPSMRTAISRELPGIYEDALIRLGCTEEDAKRNADALRSRGDIDAKTVNAVYSASRANESAASTRLSGQIDISSLVGSSED